jgi:DNA adenine methylase
MEPVLKWAGGKRKLMPNIIDLFPSNYKKRAYHEPFFGGGAVFFKIKPNSGSINDVNSRLMTFYRVVRDQPEELISKALQYNHDKETYYELREKFNQPDLPDLERAALLLYLNKTGFNGLYRVNSKGEFNVPRGQFKKPRVVNEKRIRTASSALQKVELRNEDFSYILDYAQKGDLCYFDPPYQPVSSTANFTSYAVNGFDLSEQKKLRDVCLELDKKGVYWVLSNSFAKPVRELYENVENFKIETVQAPRAISCKASTRGLTKEILVTNIPEEKRELTGFFLKDQKVSVHNY